MGIAFRVRRFVQGSGSRGDEMDRPSLIRLFRGLRRGAAAITLPPVALVVVLAPVVCRAQGEASGSQNKKSEFTYGAELDINTRYVWRGLALTHGPVIQPSVWVSKSGFTLTLWGNLSLSDEAEQKRLSEIIPIITYSREWKKLTIEPSVTFYFTRPLSPAVDPPTGEASIRFSYPVGPVGLFTDQNIDFISYRGAYFGDAGISYERELSRKASLAGAITTGWGSSKFNNVYIGEPKKSFNFAGAELSFQYSITRSLRLRPHFEF